MRWRAARRRARPSAGWRSRGWTRPPAARAAKKRERRVTKCARCGEACAVHTVDCPSEVSTHHERCGDLRLASTRRLERIVGGSGPEIRSSTRRPGGIAGSRGGVGRAWSMSTLMAKLACSIALAWRRIAESVAHRLRCVLAGSPPSPTPRPARRVRRDATGVTDSVAPVGDGGGGGQSWSHEGRAALARRAIAHFCFDPAY